MPFISNLQTLTLLVMHRSAGRKLWRRVWSSSKSMSMFSVPGLAVGLASDSSPLYDTLLTSPSGTACSENFPPFCPQKHPFRVIISPISIQYDNNKYMEM